MALDYAPLQRDLADVGYIADDALAMVLCLMIGLGRPQLSRTSSRVSDRERTGLAIYLCLKILAQSAITLLTLRRIRLRTLLSNLIRDESGVTAIEYALIAALIAVAAIAAFTLVGTNLSTPFSTIAAKL